MGLFMSPEPMGEFLNHYTPLDLSCCEASYNHQSQVITVEPPNKGHLWEQSFCPLFEGCPLVGGSSQYAIYSPLKT